MKTTEYRLEYCEDDSTASENWVGVGWYPYSMNNYQAPRSAAEARDFMRQIARRWTTGLRWRVVKVEKTFPLAGEYMR